MQFNRFKQKIQTLAIQVIIWMNLKKLNQYIGMKKVNHGIQNLSKLKNIMDLQNADIVKDQCHTI